MDKTKVVVVGSSGHSKVVIDVLEKEEKYQIIGLLDAYREKGGETLGYKVIGQEEDLPEILLVNAGCQVFIAIGDNWIRKKVKDKIVAIVPEVTFATTVHPSAQIARDVTIGKGTAIMAGAVVNSATSVGEFSILNTRSSVDHDCSLADFTSLAPNATTGGSVAIGEFSAVSISATIKHGVSVGKHTVVGAGAVLLKNCGDNVIVYGVPAQVVRKRQAGEKYL